jgi:primosomal protein N'
MATSTIPCPYCKTSVTLETGKVEKCPSCGGDVRVHDVGTEADDEALKRLLAKVKLVERVGEASKPDTPVAAPKTRPWWKFWA